MVRISDDDELLRYAYRVSAAVGLMLAPLLGVRGEAAEQRVVDLGLALQLSNILIGVAGAMRDAIACTCRATRLAAAGLSAAAVACSGRSSVARGVAGLGGPRRRLFHPALPLELRWSAPLSTRRTAAGPRVRRAVGARPAEKQRRTSPRSCHSTRRRCGSGSCFSAHGTRERSGLRLHVCTIRRCTEPSPACAELTSRVAPRLTVHSSCDALHVVDSRAQESTPWLANAALPRIVFVLGKGGVGRSTVAAALGVLLAERGERVRAGVGGRRLYRPVVRRAGGRLQASPDHATPLAVNYALDEALRAYFVDPFTSVWSIGTSSDPRRWHRCSKSRPVLRRCCFWASCGGDHARRTRGGLAFDRIVVDAPATGTAHRCSTCRRRCRPWACRSCSRWRPAA